MNIFTRKSWSPYVVGTLIGVLSWATFYTVDKPLGASTTFVRVAGLLEQAVVPQHVADNAYFAKTKLKIDWQMMLVLGVMIGAWFSSRLSGGGIVERVPELWRERFGESRPLRYAAAVLGGVLLLYGARLAGGCTSGHGMSGSLQLAASGWTFFMAVFAAGIATAFTLYGKVRNHV